MLYNGGDDKGKQASPLRTSTLTTETSELIARDVKWEAVAGATLSDSSGRKHYLYRGKVKYLR